MSITVKCAECGKGYQVADDKAGLRIKCAECQSLISIPAAMQQPEESKQTRGKKKERSPVERAIVWSAIALLVIFLGVEWHGRHGYSSTIAAFQEAVRADEQVEFTFANAQTMVSGWPIVRTGENWTTYRWPSLIHTYKIKLSLGLSGSVVSVDTQFDESKLQEVRVAATRVPTTKEKDEPGVDDGKTSTAAAPVAASGQRAITELTAAWKTFQASGNSAQFTTKLRGIAGQLPELKVSTEPGSPVWNRITLNSWMTGVDAFRFKSPLKVPADMYWCFSVPKTTGNWYIIQAGGTMEGFNNFDAQRNCQYAGAALPVENYTVHQTLLGGQIRPDTHYIIWNVPRNNQPVEWQLAISLFPQGQQQQVGRSEEIEKIIGLKPPGPDFPDTVAGLDAALRALGSLCLNGETTSARFNELLEAIAPRLAAVDLSQPTEEPIWNDVTVGANGCRFGAVRLRSGEADPQSLSAIVSSPRLLRDWGLIEVGGTAFFQPDYGIEVNPSMQIPGAGDQQVVTLHRFTGDTIESGKEYVLWFNTWDDETADVKLASCLTKGDFEEGANVSVETAKLFGFDTAEKPASERLHATLEVVRDLNQQHGFVAHTTALLQSIGASLPVVELSTSKGEAEWQKFDSTVPGIAAMRLTPPVESPSFIAAALVSTRTPRNWGIVPISGGASVVPYSKLSDADVSFEGLKFHEQNVTTYQIFFGQQLEPRQPFIYWCVYDANEAEDSPAPKEEGRVAFGFDTVALQSFPTTNPAAAAAVGVRIQQPVAPAGSILLGDHQDEVAGVQFLPDPNRLVSVGRGGKILTWDLEKKTRLAEAKNPFGDVNILKLSADGSHVALGSRTGNRVAVWTLEPFEHVGTIQGNSERLASFAISADGKELATFCGVKNNRTGFYDQGTVTLWNVDTGELLRSVDSVGESHLNLQYSAEGKRVFSVGILYPAASPAVEPRPSNPHGSFLFAWDRATLDRTLVHWGDLAFVTGLSRSEDGTSLVTTDLMGLLQRRDLPSGEVQASVALPWTINWMHASPDGRLAAIACPDSTVRLWNTVENRIVKTWDTHTKAVGGVAVSNDGRWVASASDDGTIRLWDTTFQDADTSAANLEPITDSIGIELAPIPAGEFLMGAPDNDSWADKHERPQRLVKLTRPFYMGRHEVTVGQFRQFVNATKYVTTAEKGGHGSDTYDRSRSDFSNYPQFNWQNTKFEQQDDHPVVNVSWDDAVEFCKWLSQKDSATYRLPTEAEWEYACRAGSQTVWSSGNKEYRVANVANVADASVKAMYGRINVGAGWWDDGSAYTAPVGSYAANAFGLYDMHGNVVEWCSDYYTAVFNADEVAVDPQGPASGPGRVKRGGAFYYRTNMARSSYRFFSVADYAVDYVGFRVVREMAESAKQSDDEEAEPQP